MYPAQAKTASWGTVGGQEGARKVYEQVKTVMIPITHNHPRSQDSCLEAESETATWESPPTPRARSPHHEASLLSSQPRPKDGMF